MKITQLDIEGFRSLKKVSWKPGDLNVIIGPNGSGKSNLLRMLELISYAAAGRLEQYIQVCGGIDALAWDGSSDTIGFAFNALVSQYTDPNPFLVAYDVGLQRFGYSNFYGVQHELLTDIRIPLSLISRQGASANVYFNNQYWNYKPEDLVVGELILPGAAGPFNNDLLMPFFQRQLASWVTYGSINTGPEAPIRQPVVTRLDERVASDGQNLMNVLHTLYTSDRSFKQHINSAMQAAFGNDFEELIFPPASDQRVQLRVRWKTLKREQSAADLSDGTLRFLFLLAVLASPSPAPLIAIDEPETGLHPSMLPIIAEFAVEAARKTQVIFTTHSDQFLDAFRDTRPTTTVAKWEDGETTLTTLPDEDLAYWLKGYSMGSLFRTGELEALA